MKKAELLCSYYEGNKLTDPAIVQILSGEKTRKPKSGKLQPVKEIEDTIDKALALYFENQKNEQKEVVV